MFAQMNRHCIPFTTEPPCTSHKEALWFQSTYKNWTRYRFKYGIRFVRLGLKKIQFRFDIIVRKWYWQIKDIGAQSYEGWGE